MEFDIVAIWLKVRPGRLLFGCIFGAIASFFSILLAKTLSTSYGFDSNYPLKIIGALIKGPSSTDFAASEAILPGFLLILSYGAFWGIVFAHFTAISRFLPMLGMGIAWGLWSWIFSWNLFGHAFFIVRIAHIPSELILPLCLLYGISLSCLMTLYERVFVVKKNT